MKKLQGIILWAAAIMAAGSFADPIQVSVTGTAQTTEMGYTLGQSYTFNWVVNDGYNGGSADFFHSTQNRWSAESTSDPLLWSSVSGDGLSGTYSRPAGSSGAPFDILLSNINGLGLSTLTDDSSGQGLTVNGIEVRIMAATDLDIPGLDYSDTAFINPATKLAGYTSTYALSSGTMYVQDQSNNFIQFTPTSATIAAIPEPSTIAFVGIFGGGLWIIRRYFPSV